MGTLAWALSPRLRRVTGDHMSHVLGAGAPRSEVASRSREAVRSAALYYADFARAAHQPPTEALDGLREVEGVEHLFAAFDRGCGLIVCSAHLGNPEFLTRAVAGLGFPMVVLTERLYPASVHDLVHEARSGPNVRFLPADLSGVREALRHVRAGGMLALLGDRDVLGTGVPVPFFGERAKMPAGPVELALRTGAPLVPAFVLRAPGGAGSYRAVIAPAIPLEGTHRSPEDVATGMRRLAEALEAGIRQAPGQWFPLQPVWRGVADGPARPASDPACVQ